MAAFLLALIVSLLCFPLQGWLVKWERSNSLGYHFPILKDVPAEMKGVNFSFALPKYMSKGAVYSFTATIGNERDTPVTIDDMFVDVLLPVKKIDPAGDLSTTVGPVILSKAIGEQVLPKTIMQGQTLAIASTLSPEEFPSLADLIDQGIFLDFSVRVNGEYYRLVGKESGSAAYVANDERQSLLNNIVINVLGTEKIFWLILGMSMFSCWIVEERKFQDLWLTDKHGWKAAFSIMLKGLGVFVGVLLLAVFFVAFSRLAGIAVIIVLAGMVLWIFGFSPKTLLKGRKTRAGTR